jgi:hypothetical protein
MSPYEITVVPNSPPGDDGGGQGPLRPRPRFLRLKMALAALLVGSVVIALLVAAFMIGTVIAIVALGFVAIAAAVLFIRRLFGAGSPRRYQ